MALEQRVIGRGWKSFEVQARKSLHDSEQTIKSYSGEGSEGKRRAAENTPIFLGSAKVALNRMLVERWTVKAILMRSRMEMRNLLLETEGKAILVKSRKEHG